MTDATDATDATKIDPSLQEALKNVKAPPDEADHEKRFQKLQEVMNLLVKASSSVAADLKVFIAAEGTSVFDRANLSWTGGVWLLHSSIPTIQVKPTFSTKIEGDDLTLSATDNDEQTQLFVLPLTEITQPVVNEAVKKYFEPKLTAAIDAHNKA